MTSQRGMEGGGWRGKCHVACRAVQRSCVSVRLCMRAYVRGWLGECLFFAQTVREGYEMETLILLVV